MKKIVFLCRQCNEYPCQDWCGIEKYIIPRCKCGEIMKELGLVEDLDTEHGHVGSLERSSLYVCENEDCDNWARVFYFNL